MNYFFSTSIPERLLILITYRKTNTTLFFLKKLIYIKETSTFRGYTHQKSQKVNIKTIFLFKKRKNHQVKIILFFIKCKKFYLEFPNLPTIIANEDSIKLFEFQELEIIRTMSQFSIKNKPIIMIADDNEIIKNSNKKIILEILSENRLDYDIIIGNDGYDIVKMAMLYEKKYHLIKCIFTDENMDYMPGSEAIAFLRKFEKIKKLKNTKVILCSCHEDRTILNNTIKAGADDVLSLPISKNVLKLIFSKFGIIEP